MRSKHAGVSSPVRQLRLHAIAHSLFHPTTLKAAVERLGFVQADPIRSPATAQDLVLRHRVKDFRAGDLERHYASLEIEEDVLYAYGFVARHVWQLLHPRRTTDLSELERRVLAVVRTSGPVHPKDLDAQFGGERAVNAWGSYSKATKLALEGLHDRGLLRVAGRQNGIRIYQALDSHAECMSPDDRLRKLLLVVASILAPVRETTLRAIGASLGRSVPRDTDHRMLLRDLLRTGELEHCTVDGISYIWPPPSSLVRRAPPRRVRFLAPFDPLVWDRGRFEHLWGWSYRFEAYTPAAKRVRGYYAMPLLLGERVIGWANARLVGRALNVELGFIEGRPTDRAFERELEVEITGLTKFLDLETGGPPAPILPRERTRTRAKASSSRL